LTNFTKGWLGVLEKEYFPFRAILNTSNNGIIHTWLGVGSVWI
jgi:hypothetical protein